MATMMYSLSHRLHTLTAVPYWGWLSLSRSVENEYQRLSNNNEWRWWVWIRVVIESRGSRVPNYFLKPWKWFSRLRRIDERESQTIGLPSAKFGWCPVLECRAVTLPRRETSWNLHGCPKLLDRSQLLVGRSSPYCGDMWRRYCCLTSFFSIVDMCLSCEDIAGQICAKVCRWRFLAIFCVLYFPRTTCSIFQTCILNSH